MANVDIRFRPVVPVKQQIMAVMLELTEEEARALKNLLWTHASTPNGTIPIYGALHRALEAYDRS